MKDSILVCFSKNNEIYNFTTFMFVSVGLLGRWLFAGPEFLRNLRFREMADGQLR